MSKLLWLIGGTALALAVFAILNGPDFAPGPADGVDRAAGKLASWGTKQRAVATGGKLLGKVEEFAGKLTGDPDTADQGAFDKATGVLRDAAGQTAEALGSTIHDLNKV